MRLMLWVILWLGGLGALGLVGVGMLLVGEVRRGVVGGMLERGEMVYGGVFV